MEWGKVPSMTKWKQPSVHLPGYQQSSTSCSLLGHLPLLDFWAFDPMLLTCLPPQGKQFHCKFCTYTFSLSSLGGKKVLKCLLGTMPLRRRQGRGAISHLVFERFGNLNIPTCHPTPWISGASLFPCNTYHKSLISHLSQYSRTPSSLTVFPQLMALWESPQFLKAISPSLCIKTDNTPERSCPCSPKPHSSMYAYYI